MPPCWFIFCGIFFSYYNYDKIAEIAKWIEGRIKIKPVVAIVCGSGLGGIADQVKDPQIIPYNDIPDFPRSTGELGCLFDAL